MGVAGQELLAVRRKQIRFFAPLFGIGEEIDEAQSVGSARRAGLGRAGGQVGEAGRFQIHIDDQDAKAAASENGGSIDQGHAAADSAFEGIESDEGGAGSFGTHAASLEPSVGEQ